LKYNISACISCKLYTKQRLQVFLVQITYGVQHIIRG